MNLYRGVFLQGYLSLYRGFGRAFHERSGLCQAGGKVTAEHRREIKAVLSFSCTVRKHARSNVIKRSKYDKAVWKVFLGLGEKVQCLEYWTLHPTLQPEPPMVTERVNPDLLNPKLAV